MKNRIAVFIFLLSFCASWPLSGQAGTPQPEKKKSVLSLLDLTVTPGIEYPIQLGFTLLDLGGSVDLRGTLPLPFLPWLSVGADVSYSFLPTLASSSISLVSVGAGARATWELSPRFSLYGSLSAGGYYGFFNATVVDAAGAAYSNQQGGDPFLAGGGGLDFFLTPSFSIGVDAGLVWYVGMNLGLRATIGGSFHLDGLARKVTTENIQFNDLFPSLYKLYQKSSPGSAVLANDERFPMTDIKVSVFAKEYMNAPTASSAPARLEPGASVPLDLDVLLSDRVLDLKEATQVNAEIRVDYTLNGRKQTALSLAPLRILNRNAMVWNDDRKVAAFVTPTDPEVLGFSKLAAGMVRDAGPATMNQNLRMVMGMFSALSYYGMKYVVDPNSPSYTDAAKNQEVVDFLQFPRQTLSYKGGDCDDLSILLSSLLESVGVETAFVTVPGHIFIAASLAMDPAEARTSFAAPNDLIYRGGKTWLPFEVTMLGSGFTRAWQTAAREWRDGSDKGQAAFYPSQECWSRYEMSGAPSDAVSIRLPVPAQVRSAYDIDMAVFVDNEIGTRVKDLTAQIAKLDKPAKERNKLGVLYAQYGKMQEAEAQFLAALAVAEYVPALMNLSTIRFSRGDFQGALTYLQRAERAAPDNPGVLVGMARVSYEMANTAQVDKYVALAEKSSPGSTDKFPYLKEQEDASATARAGDALARMESLTWAIDQ